jgi:hypothetical protein
MIDSPTAVVYDLDSTIADTRQRWHLAPLLPGGRAPGRAENTWREYALACAGDALIPGIAERMKLDHEHHQVHICSGRDAAAHDLTLGWLERMVPGRWDFLQLQKLPERLKGDDTGRTNSAHEIRYIQGLLESGVQVVMVYEDWPAVACQVREATGVPVLTVNPCYDSAHQESDGMKRAGLSPCPSSPAAASMSRTARAHGAGGHR